MKKSIIVSVLSVFLISSVVMAAECDPAKLGPEITAKVTQLQKDQEKFAKIDAPLHAILAEIPALREAGKTEELCVKLNEMNTMLDEAAK